MTLNSDMSPLLGKLRELSITQNDSNSTEVLEFKDLGVSLVAP